MKNINYKYNPETLEYIEVKTSLWAKIKKISYYLIASIVFSFIILSVSFYYLRNYIKKESYNESQNIRQEINAFNADLNNILEVLNDIQERDDNIYRSIFETNPYPNYKRKLGTGGNPMKFKKFEGLTHENILTEIAQKIELVEKKLVAQSKSFDEVFKLTKAKQEMLKSIPSIQPVSNKDLTRIASGFGTRMHPIYKIPKFHSGIDFTAPIGTEIYATGNGTIERAAWSGGYGKTIIINHGYGYKTKYAHCSKLNCKTGQKVKRGDLIGFIGNTGQSTGPHLHYEVLKNKKPVNPINFFFKDLNAEEYARVIEISTRPTQSM